MQRYDNCFFYFYIRLNSGMAHLSGVFRFILFLFLPMFLIGQNARKIDSLVDVLAKTRDQKLKCLVLNELFNEHIRWNIDKAGQYSKQSLEIARAINYPKGISEAVYNQSGIYRIKGEYDSALSILVRAKQDFIKLNDSTAFADYLSNIGYLFTLKDDPKNALINLLEAQKIYEATGSTKNLSLLYNRFGSLYKSQKQYDSALAYYDKSLKINEADGFKLGSSANLINIGNIYEEKGDHDRAIGYFKKSLAIKEQIGDKQGIGKCLNNIGASYMNLGDVSGAIRYHEKALKLAQEYNGNLEISMAYVNLGFDYQKDKQYRQAVLYAGKGFETASKINDLKLLRESTRVLAESHDALRNFEQAFRYHVLFKKYSDSIVNENNLKALTEIKTKYNFATKENEIRALRIDKSTQELEIQTMRAWYNLAIGLFISLIVLALFFYFRSRESRKLSLKLKEINEMKSHFFANLSHEFRTPLTLMLGPAEKLLETSSPKDRPWLELIHRNASRLLFLDEQLLEFTRIDSGIQKIHLAEGNIISVLRYIIESFEPMAVQKNIRFTSHWPDSGIETLFDPDILEKVTVNVLSNAFKYTPAGGSIDFEATVETDRPGPGNPAEKHLNGPWIRIAVHDTGIGIPEHKQEQIFERFYQLNHNQGNTVGGVGIGLALTKELLKLHHGHISLESSVGEGSLFAFYLPLDRSRYSAEELSTLSPFKPRHSHPDLPVSLATVEGVQGESSPFPFNSDEPGKPMVLVVDDNKDMLTYINEILHHHFAVTEAENGQQGFEIASEMLPDLIITDVMMQPVDGIEFCRQLKTDVRTSHIPVIMLTALSGQQDKILGLETGADDYITKPFSMSELTVRIRNLVVQRNKLKQLFSGSIMVESKAISVTSMDEKFLDKLMRLVEEHIDQPELDTEFLLTNIGMSRSQLHRKVKALTGQPITGFIRIIRIRRAARLMEQKFGNVSAIMYAVGFNNLSYFTKCFREVYGVTPTEFMTK